MTFKPGQSGNPQGKPKGTLSKSTVAAKEALQIAFQGIGGVKRLQEWANDEPTEFFKLWGKLIPRDIELAGKDGEAILIKVLTFVPPAPEKKPDA